jgi:hypothetical protein
MGPPARRHPIAPSQVCGGTTGGSAQALEAARTSRRTKARGCEDHARRCAQVLSKVEKNVDERVAYFRRRRQSTRVVAASPHLPGALAGTVRSMSCPRGEALKAANQRLTRRRLDDQMQVIGLNREMR